VWKGPNKANLRKMKGNCNWSASKKIYEPQFHLPVSYGGCLKIKNKKLELKRLFCKNVALCETNNVY
jgi:hypothetical protein